MAGDDDPIYGFKKQTELVEVEVHPAGLVLSPPLAPSYGNPAVDDKTHDGSVDLHARPVSKSHSGGFKAAALIIGVELGERLAYYGIQGNLFVYLTAVFHESYPEASRNTINWTGVTQVMPIVGGFLADAYWGRYWTIAIVSAIYVLGMLMITLSTSVPSLKPKPCAGTICPKVSRGQVGFFFLSLYMISIGTGGIKPCLEAFGADQFDDEDATERKWKSSFFNWWYFAIALGALIAVTVISYIMTHKNWGIGLGFGILTIVMLIACIIFYAGSFRYRYKLPGGSPLTQITQVLVACLRNRHAKLPTNPSSLHEIFTDPSMPASRRQLLHTDKLRFLDKAAVDVTSQLAGHALERPASAWKLCTVTQVEEVKLVLRLIPVWLTTFMYGVVVAQSYTFFQNQVSTLDTALGNFHVPVASFQVFITLTVLISLPIYDRVFVPMARRLTGIERGITMLQRIGVGLFFSFLCMVAAAILETKRLSVATRYGLLDTPKGILPMSAFWIMPQYILLGIADVFALVGEQEFFYDQVPDSMRSLGLALHLSANGLGSFINNLLIMIVHSVTRNDPWLPPNLNRSRIDLFYWLLAGLSMLNLLAFNLVAYFYEYKKVRSPHAGLSINEGVAPAAHTGLSQRDSLQRYHHRPSNASSTSSL